MTIEVRQPDDLDSAATRDVIRSIASTGDFSQLSEAQRGDVIRSICGALGLNPLAKPFDFLRLSGKLVLYANRGATDQLAAVHRVNRRIVRGPEAVEILGKRAVIAVCEATLPNGRVEQSTATCDAADACGPFNVLMKVETKAKRRATLAILGLAVLDEMEVEAATVERQPAPVVARWEPEGSRAFAAFVTAAGVCERVVEVAVIYRDLIAGLHEEGEDAADYLSGDDGAYALAGAVIRRRVSVSEAELRATLTDTAGDLARALDAAADHAGDLDTAARWWVGGGKPTDPAHAAIVWRALARTVAGIGHADAVASGRATSALKAACAALTPPDPPTGTDAPSTPRQTAANGQGAESTGSDAPSAWSSVTTSDGVVIDDEASARRHIAGLNVWALRHSYRRHPEPGWRVLVAEHYAATTGQTFAAAVRVLDAEVARAERADRDRATAKAVRRAA